MSITKYVVKIGETVDIELPHSEVCMYMRVAGKVRPVTLQKSPISGYISAQILNLDGTPFSSPIAYGEAGFYREDDGTYNGSFYVTRLEHSIGDELK